jgi:vacuolar-type H+-ATPase subunit H
MENSNTLDHLLDIEAKASALVKDAQEEAEKRIHENEIKNQTAYEERFKVEAQKLEDSLIKEKEKLRTQYKQTLDEYRNEISNININVDRFSSLLNKYIAGEG